jgi:hypothetical protein
VRKLAPLDRPEISASSSGTIIAAAQNAYPHAALGCRLAIFAMVARCSRLPSSYEATTEALYAL